MNKKDVAEIKKRYDPEKHGFTRIAGVYVNNEKNIVSSFSESPLSFTEDEFWRYLDVAKKSLSGKVGNNLLEHGFASDSMIVPIMEDLIQTELKDDNKLNSLYDFIIDNYTCTDNYFIIVFADTYDVPSKASDGADLDESEIVYQYVMVSICPVKKTKPSLGFREDENRIGEILPVWSASPVDTAFLYPAFSDRYPDNDHIMTYSKKPDAPHNELFNDAMSLKPVLSSAEKKNSFFNAVDTVLASESADQADEKRFNIADGLDRYIKSRKVAEGETESDKTDITPESIKKVMMNAGIDENKAENVINSFEESCSDDDVVTAEELTDSKYLKLADLYHQKQALQREVKRLSGGADNENVKEININLPENLKDSIIRLTQNGTEYIAVPAGSVSVRINGKKA